MIIIDRREREECVCVGVFVRQKSKINNTSEISLIRNKLNRSQFPSKARDLTHNISQKKEKEATSLKTLKIYTADIL